MQLDGKLNAIIQKPIEISATCNLPPLISSVSMMVENSDESPLERQVNALASKLAALEDKIKVLEQLNECEAEKVSSSLDTLSFNMKFSAISGASLALSGSFLVLIGLIFSSLSPELHRMFSGF